MCVVLHREMRSVYPQKQQNVFGGRAVPTPDPLGELTVLTALHQGYKWIKRGPEKVKKPTREV